MKKLYSLILLLVTSLLLVGCQSPTDDLPKDYYTQEELDILLQEKIDSIEIVDYSYLDDEILLLETYISQLQLQLQEQQLEIDLLKQEFANLGFIDGLNGQRTYYTSNTGYTNMGYTYLADAIDKTKLPSYLFDLEGNPIDFNYLCEGLKLKYFEVGEDINDSCSVGSRASISLYLDADIDNDEYMARLYSMLQELRNYDYWLIGTSELMVYVVTPQEQYITLIYMPSFRSQGFNLTLEDYHLQQWEIYQTFTFDLEIAQALYDQYVLEDKFIGYVLELE